MILNEVTYILQQFDNCLHRDNILLTSISSASFCKVRLTHIEREDTERQISHFVVNHNAQNSIWVPFVRCTAPSMWPYLLPFQTHHVSLSL